MLETGTGAKAVSRNASSRGRRRTAAAAAVLAAAAMAGCGGNSGDSVLAAESAGSSATSAPSTGKSSPTSSGATGPSTSGTTGRATVKPPPPPDTDDEGFAWSPFGPANPGDPPPQQWYGNLEQANCRGLASSVGDEPGRELWRALAAVCAAALLGDASQWAVAEQAAAQAEPDGEGPDSCLSRAARALLERALAWHARHPDAVPRVTLPKPGSRTACPFRIRTVNLSGPDGPIPTTAPSGPLAGGTTLDLVVDGAGQRPRVFFGDVEGILVTNGLGHVVVQTPPGATPGPVRIRLRNHAGEVVAPVDFTYTAEGG